jgi:hypothetical protein
VNAVAISIAEQSARLGTLAITVIGSTGCLGRVAEWQTRWLQVPVSFGTWGFKSPFAHRCDEASHGLHMSCAIGYRLPRLLAGVFLGCFVLRQ